MRFLVGNYFHSFKLCSSCVMQITDAMGRKATENQTISERTNHDDYGSSHRKLGAGFIMQALLSYTSSENTNFH